MAGEMEREGFTHPAAHRRRHHLAGPHRREDRAELPGPTVHVLDASRAVGVAGSLLSDSCATTSSRAFARSTRTVRAQRSRDRPRGAAAADRRCAAEPARHRLDRHGAAEPCSTGLTVLEDYPLDELVPRIDWTPFFQTWELPGHYPDILEDPRVGRAATSLFRDAQALLDRIVRERLLRRARVFGFFHGERGRRRHRALRGRGRATEQLAVIHTLRQQMLKPPGPAQPRAGRLRGAARAGCRRLHRRLRGDRGHRPRRADGRVRGARTTTTAPSWPRRSPTGWPRRSPSGCTSGCAGSTGATRRTRRSTTTT